jgi:hypothetical protein
MTTTKHTDPDYRVGGIPWDSVVHQMVDAATDQHLSSCALCWFTMEATFADDEYKQWDVFPSELNDGTVHLLSTGKLLSSDYVEAVADLGQYVPWQQHHKLDVVRHSSGKLADAAEWIATYRDRHLQPQRPRVVAYWDSHMAVVYGGPEQ